MQGQGLAVAAGALAGGAALIAAGLFVGFALLAGVLFLLALAAWAILPMGAAFSLLELEVDNAGGAALLVVTIASVTALRLLGIEGIGDGGWIAVLALAIVGALIVRVVAEAGAGMALCGVPVLAALLAAYLPLVNLVLGDTEPEVERERTYCFAQMGEFGAPIEGAPPPSCITVGGNDRGR
ncbi:MAG: hypothetical protein OXT09_08600 [Myxococcales bacterium]|nr:hypothetical protein [Myxococcales bacterium]